MRPGVVQLVPGEPWHPCFANRLEALGGTHNQLARSIIADGRGGSSNILQADEIMCYARLMIARLSRFFVDYIVGDALAPNLPRSIRAGAFLVGGTVGLALNALIELF